MSTRLNRRIGTGRTPKPPTLRHLPLYQRSLIHDLDGPLPASWSALANTADELNRLHHAVRGVPTEWLEWTAQIVRKRVERLGAPNSIMDFHLSVLRNGLIQFQESKFLCDIMENALRSAFVCKSRQHQLDGQFIYSKIPCRNNSDVWQELAIKMKESCDENTVAKLVSVMTFYQLHYTITTFWTELPSGKNGCTGFHSLFTASKHCLDGNLFKHDMGHINRIRNTIAHSKELLQPHQVRSLAQLVDKWLSPMGVILQERVSAYRQERPRFLGELEIK